MAGKVAAAAFSTRAPAGPYSIKKEGKTLTHNRKYANGEEEEPHKHLLEAESHSRTTLKLIERDPGLADLLREKLSGALLKFASGAFGDDFTQDMSRAFVALSREMFHSVRIGQDGVLSDYSHLFTNLVCMVGNIGFCGSIPSFRFKVKFVKTDEQVWLSLFYTPTEQEELAINNDESPLQLETAREGLGKQAVTANRVASGSKMGLLKGTSKGSRGSPSSSQPRGKRALLDAGLEGEVVRAASQGELGALLNRKSDSHAVSSQQNGMANGLYSIKKEGATLTHNRIYDGDQAASPHKHLLEAESHSKMSMKLINRDPGLADILREKLSSAVEKFSQGTFDDDLTQDTSRSYVGLARDMFHVLRKDEDGRLADYSHLFTNFMCTVGNMGYCGSIPCFRFKVKFVETDKTVWLSLFYTPTEEEQMLLNDCETRAQLEPGRAGLGQELKTVNRLAAVAQTELCARVASRLPPDQPEHNLEVLELLRQNAILQNEVELMRNGGQQLSRSSSRNVLRRSGSSDTLSPTLKPSYYPSSSLCLRERERAEARLNTKLAECETREKARAETNTVLIAQLESCEAQAMALRAEIECQRTAARAATFEAEAVKAGSSAALVWAEQCAAGRASDTPLLRTQLSTLQRCASECDARTRDIQAMKILCDASELGRAQRGGRAFDPTRWAARKKEAIEHAQNLRAAQMRAKTEARAAQMGARMLVPPLAVDLI